MLNAYGLMHIESALSFHCLECPSRPLFKEADTNSVMSIKDTKSPLCHNRHSAGVGLSAGEQQTKMLIAFKPEEDTGI